MDRALCELRAQGYPVLEPDVPRLSPFVRRRIGIDGHYSFHLPDFGDAHRPLPSAQTGRAAPLTRARRIELLGQILTNADAPLRSRVAAGLLLLYAQPVSRIVRLTLDEIIHDGDQVLIRLGDPPSPVPQPFAALLLDYAAHRSNMRTATNPESRWLFPGRRANQPLRPEYLATLVHELGVPTVAGRGAAIRQHVLDMPAPIVADALGYHHNTTTRLAAEAGTTWSRYAPGDDTRSSSPRTRGG